MKTQNNSIVTDYRELKKIVDAHRILGHKIVCTVGSWDMLHVGHLRYLIKAREYGDILVVGTDSDRGIKLYKKNNLRPIIPQEERMEMLKYQECVDYVTLIDDIDNEGRWQYELIKLIEPDFFITTPESYPEDQVKDIKQYVNEIIVLPRQAQYTSSTKIIEGTVKKHIEAILNEVIKKG